MQRDPCPPHFHLLPFHPSFPHRLLHKDFAHAFPEAWIVGLEESLPLTPPLCLGIAREVTAVAAAWGLDQAGCRTPSHPATKPGTSNNNKSIGSIGSVLRIPLAQGEGCRLLPLLVPVLLQVCDLGGIKVNIEPQASNVAVTAVAMFPLSQYPASNMCPAWMGEVEGRGSPHLLPLLGGVLLLHKGMTQLPCSPLSLPGVWGGGVGSSSHHSVPFFYENGDPLHDWSMILASWVHHLNQSLTIPYNTMHTFIKLKRN